MKLLTNQATINVLQKELLSLERLLDIVLADEPESELSDYYPEWKAYIDEINEQITDIKVAIQDTTMLVPA